MSCYSGAYHNLVFYFRKSLWKGLANLAVRDLTQKMFQPLPSRQVGAIIESHPFGASYVRVVSEGPLGPLSVFWRILCF